MLIEFTVGNHLSFKDKKTLSLEAAPIKEFEENTFKAGSYTLLKSAVIYGANSSGKSNLIKSFATMRSIVLESAKTSSKDKINVKPFLLNTETESLPSYFEILILIDNVRYRYGFEADENIVHTEWLFKRNSKAESLLFIRDKDKIEITKEFQEGKEIAERTRGNALFLSAVDQWNGGDVSKKIVGWFSGAIDVLSGLSHDNKLLTIALSKSSNLKGYLNNIINQLDLGFKEFKVNRDNKEDISSVFTHHDKYDIVGNATGSHWFNLSAEESSGTNKIFDLAGHISVGLLFNKVIFIDELDAKLHPLLTLRIVKLFNSPEYNISNGQLIFATHDTNLLSYGDFRRDQVYFTEKNQFEETDLYSLVEFKDSNGVKPRNDRSFEKDYIKGRYGAIPFIGDFSNLLSSGQSSKD